MQDTFKNLAAFGSNRLPILNFNFYYSTVIKFDGSCLCHQHIHVERKNVIYAEVNIKRNIVLHYSGQSGIRNRDHLDFHV